jgi:hypothetical protein
MQAEISPPRYTKIPLPDRKFIPGQGIHPDKDPQGSHIPEVNVENVEFTPERWQNAQRYLYAIDLFNHGFWWEAHEVLEGLWIQTGRTTPLARFIQGIIQISAALLKDPKSMPRGTSRLLANGLSKLGSQSGIYLGIHVETFCKEVENYFKKADSTPPKIILQGFQ